MRDRPHRRPLPPAPLVDLPLNLGPADPEHFSATGH